MRRHRVKHVQHWSSPDPKLCNGCMRLYAASRTGVALPMATIMKYDITPTESAKSEVTMRISVKNWSKESCLEADWGSVSVTSVMSVTSVTYVCRLPKLCGNHLCQLLRRSFLGVIFDGESIGDIPRSPF